MNVLSARRRTMRARFHADCRRSSRKGGERVSENQTVIGQSRTGLAALNDRRFCPSDSWLQGRQYLPENLHFVYSRIHARDCRLKRQDAGNARAAGRDEDGRTKDLQKKITNYRYSMFWDKNGCSQPEHYHFEIALVTARAGSRREGSIAAICAVTCRNRRVLKLKIYISNVHMLYGRAARRRSEHLTLAMLAYGRQSLPARILWQGFS